MIHKGTVYHWADFSVVSFLMRNSLETKNPTMTDVIIHTNGDIYSNLWDFCCCCYCFIFLVLHQSVLKYILPFHSLAKATFQFKTYLLRQAKIQPQKLEA